MQLDPVLVADLVNSLCLKDCIVKKDLIPPLCALYTDQATHRQKLQQNLLYLH